MLLTRIGEFAELDPVKMAFGLAKMAIEIADNVKGNMGTIERRIYSVLVQLDATRKALEEWTESEESEKRAVQRFKKVLEAEFTKLKQLSDEGHLKRIANCDDDTARIADILERVNEARLQLGVEADLRAFKMAHVVDRHVRESLLNRLKPSEMADHTYELEGAQRDRLRRVICTHGTRVALQDDIIAWAKEGSELVYWLSGPAGSGKSTIAYTLARRFELATPDDPVVLGANFFCSRHYEETRFATRIIRTIAYQLALRFKPFADALVEVGEFSNANKSVQDLVKHLLIQPWQRVLKLRSSANALKAQQHHIIIIDALDELDPIGRSHFLRTVLPAIAKDSLQGLKFLITSRLDPHLAQQLATYEAANAFRLQDISPEEARGDIEVYLTECLSHLVDTPQLKQLVALTDGLFVYAATIVHHLLPRTPPEQMRFIRDFVIFNTRTSPETRTPSFGQPIATRLLDRLYHQLLMEAFESFEPGHVDYVQRLRMVHTFLCAHEPVTLSTAACLVFEDEYTNTNPTLSMVSVAGNVVDLLHAVLYVHDGKVLSYHKSFADFIFDNARSGQFSCDPSEHHRFLAQASFRIMMVGLRFNITDIPSSHILDSNNPALQKQIYHKIPAGLRYACCHWARHLISLSPSPPPNPDPLCDALYTFLRLPALFWIEAMNLLGVPGLCDTMFQSAYDFISPYELPCAAQVLEASNFATYFAGSPASLSTPHLYISSLATWPRDVLPVSGWRDYFPGIPQFTYPHRGVMCLSVFRTTSLVSDVEFSPDASKVVSGTHDGLVRVIDSSTGAVLKNLVGHEDEVWAVACSIDGRWIASGSKDRTVRIWNAQTAQLLSTLRAHRYGVDSVAFSPDGTRIVSGSNDRLALVWDLTSGTVEHILDAHIGAVLSVVYSPDGRWIATGSSDTNVFLWDAKSGKVSRKLIGHGSKVLRAAFSDDSLRIASCGNDGAKLWDLHSGQCLLTITSPTALYSIAFIPNKQQIVVASRDARLRVYNSSSGEALWSLDGHTSVVCCVAASSNGRRFVSGCLDKTVRVWDASMPGPLYPSGHRAWVHDIAVSANGKQIVSTSMDNTIRIWDSATGDLLRTMYGKDGGGFWSVALFSDALLFVTGCSHGVVIWDGVAGEAIGNLKSSSEPVTAVAVSEDGKRIFSGSCDGSVDVWDAETHASLKDFQAHDEEVTALCVSRSGARIVSASEDCTLKVWEIMATTIIPY